MASEFILETRGLTKEFKGFAAVQDVNLKIRRGTIHALIGPNGAGKTTVFNLLTKFLQPTRGEIVYDGVDITREEPAQIARRGVIRSFQISATFGHMTALENVRVGLQRRSVRVPETATLLQPVDRWVCRTDESPAGVMSKSQPGHTLHPTSIDQ